MSPGWKHEARATLVLAVPMAAGQVGQMLLGISDSLMVGRVGVVPLAAAAFANGVINVLLVAGIGLVAAVSVLAAQAHGAGRPREAGEAMRHGLALGIAAGVAAALAVTCGRGVFRFFGQPPEVLDAAGPFLVLTAWSVVPALAMQALKQFCEALSRPWPPMLLMTAAVGLNAGLSWVLIYGKLGAPALGLTGAGWATLAARTLTALALAGFVLGSRGLRGALPERWWRALSWARTRQMLHIGLPVAATLLMEVTAFATAAVMMGWINAEALAAHQIAISCAALTFMFPLGLSFAVSVRVGQALGAGERGRVRPIGFGGIGMGAVMMVGSAALYLLAGPTVARWFVDDAGVVALAARLLAVAGLFQLVDGVQVVSGGALRGLGDVRVPTGIAFVSYWLIALPTSYGCGFVAGFGAMGVWAGLALGLAFAAVGLTWRFRAKTAGVMARSLESSTRENGELAAVSSPEA